MHAHLQWRSCLHAHTRIHVFPPNHKGRARAKFQFRPQGAGELAMEKEDELEVEKDEGDWLLCRSMRGEGMVPANHTKPFVE